MYLSTSALDVENALQGENNAVHGVLCLCRGDFTFMVGHDNVDDNDATFYDISEIIVVSFVNTSQHCM